MRQLENDLQAKLSKLRKAQDARRKATAVKKQLIKESSAADNYNSDTLDGEDGVQISLKASYIEKLRWMPFFT